MDCGRLMKNDKASLPNEGGIDGKSVFGKYSDSDMLSFIKGLALDPCASGTSRSSIQPLWNQTLKLRKFMELSSEECPRRKRKLQQFLRDNFPAVRGLKSGKSNQQNVTKRSGQLSRSSLVSCLLNSVDSPESSNQKIFLNSHCSESLLTCEDSSPGNEVLPEFSHLDNTIDWSPPIKNICQDESDESANVTVPLSPKNLTLNHPSSLNFDDSVYSSNYSSSEEPTGVYLQAPRRQSNRLANFIGDHLKRVVLVPIGHRFQADVPEWTGLLNKENLNDYAAESENSRWLGTRIWPLEGRNVETILRPVGEGRPGYCPCVSPGSVGCSKHHVLKEKLLLKSDLGPAFFSWKFDEMGEEVSKSWTLKEQERFESLAKTYPVSRGKDFFKHALNCFPSKGREKILRYYFNVFIPRHMSPAN